jgi:hypothetical protein
VQTVVLVLAVLGGVALGYRLLRRLVGFGLAFAEATAASQLAEISARRGDLTTLAERQANEQVARRRQWTDIAFAVLYLLWLIVPLFTEWTQPLYAAASPLWLLPRRPIRIRPTQTDSAVRRRSG